MPLDRARQHDAFHVAADLDEILRGKPVMHALDLMLDDRALVEIARHVMGGRADELDAAPVRLAVGRRPLEARQERVVDVDDAPGMARAEFLREYLHVTRKDDEL